MRVPPGEITGKRLKLRPVQWSDLELVHQYASDPEVCRYVPWGPRKSLEQTEKYMQKCLERYEKGEAEVADWSVERVTDGQFLGKVSLHHPDSDLVRLGIVLNKQFWNQGYGTEALQLLIRAAFEDYSFKKVTGYCNVDNMASARMMEKAGMEFRGVEEDPGLEEGEKEYLKRERRVYEFLISNL